MNRETRDKFASGTDQSDLTTGNACWQTAPAIFEQLTIDYGPFYIDLCADPARTLLPAWFGPGSPIGVDALVAPWHKHASLGYCNPPYGAFVGKILAKAKREAAEGFTSLFLLPLRVTAAFRKHVLRGASDLILADKRLVFFENGVPRCGYDKQGRPRADCAMFDSMLVQYTPGWEDGSQRPRLSEWKMPDHVFAADIEKWVALHPYAEWIATQKATQAA